MSKNYTFSVSTITPVSIGDGAALSPLVDYVLERNQLHYIDKKKLEQLFVNFPAAFEDYLKEIDSIAYSGRNDVLEKMFKDYFQIDAKSIAKISIPAFGIKQAEEVKTIVKDAGRPFIPGSTLKGAIKATIMYDWLKNNATGKVALENFISYLSIHPLDLKEMCFVNYVDKQNNDRIKESETKKINKCHKASDYLDYLFEKEIENKLFGDLTARKRMDSSLIQVSDSQVINIEKLCALGLFRLPLFPKVVVEVPQQKPQQPKPKIANDNPFAVLNNLKIVEEEKKNVILENDKKQDSIPLIREAISANENNITTFNLQVIDEIKTKIFNHDLKFLNCENQILFQKINQFAIDYVKFEIDTLQEQSIEYRNKILKYNSFLTDNLSLKLDVADNYDEAFLCLGMGKSYLLNSIGLLIANKDKIKFKKFREIYQLGDLKDVNFPATRTLCRESQLPLGWIKIKLAKN